MHILTNRIVLSSLLGTFMCWYDFLIFGIATSLVFQSLFFPGHSFLVPMMVFAVGFLARPLGSIVWGILADKFGRKPVLLWTMALTGLSSFLIGLLPTYDQIGIAAAVILVTLRILQTFALGGEFASATTLLAEHFSENKHRGLITSLTAGSLALALVASSSLFALLTSFGDDFFLTWGWRIPFLISLFLIVLGVYIRYRVLETPQFTQMQTTDQIVANPLVEVYQRHKSKILLSIGLYAITPAWFYITTTYGFAYLTGTHGIAKSEVMQTWSMVAYILIAAMVFWGWLGDKVGRLRLIVGCAVASLLLAHPLFQWMQQGMIFLPLFVGVAILMAATFASVPGLFTEIYPDNVRATASGLSLNLGTMIGGGIVPLIATQLFEITGDLAALAWLFVLMAVTALICAVALSRQNGLDQISARGT